MFSCQLFKDMCYIGAGIKGIHSIGTSHRSEETRLRFFNTLMMRCSNSFDFSGRCRIGRLRFASTLSTEFQHAIDIATCTGRHGLQHISAYSLSSRQIHVEVKNALASRRGDCPKIRDWGFAPVEMEKIPEFYRITSFQIASYKIPFYKTTSYLL